MSGGLIIVQPLKKDRAAWTMIRFIALLEGLKGALVLAIGFALIGYIHTDLESVCEDLVRNLHLNPALGFPRIFIRLASAVPEGQMRLLVVGAMLYAVLRFVEAVGLWQKRLWAEWFALISSGLYFPVELYELSRGFSSLKVGFLLLNFLIVGYLWLAVQRRAAFRVQKHSNPPIQ